MPPTLCCSGLPGAGRWQAVGATPFSTTFVHGLAGSQATTTLPQAQLCPCCQAAPETMEHFLMGCNAYNEREATDACRGMCHQRCAGLGCLALVSGAHNTGTTLLKAQAGAEALR